MPSRIFPFVNDQYYHVYNRGSEKRSIFEGRRDYSRFLKTLDYYQLDGPKPKLSKYFKYQKVKLDQKKKIIEIICYCLMPNHFHFLIKQVKDGGITEFLGKISNSYTKYFNTKYNRIGPLLQGEFKAVLIEDDSQLIHVSRYIHLNPLTSFVIKDLNNYQWSSYREYIRNTNDQICNKDIVMSLFKSPETYQQFVMDQADYGQQLETIKHQLIDEI
ncbi:MAG: hypothetical protein C4584_01650 [Armatimonadetes bacterium]|nr:MAG: hypothetical protein C4584_01650 [Armatimonadota bacterium]